MKKLERKHVQPYIKIEKKVSRAQKGGNKFLKKSQKGRKKTVVK